MLKQSVNIHVTVCHTVVLNVRLGKRFMYEQVPVLPHGLTRGALHAASYLRQAGGDSKKGLTGLGRKAAYSGGVIKIPMR